MRQLAHACPRTPAWPWLAGCAALAALAGVKLLADGGPAADRAANLALDVVMWAGALACLARVARYRTERVAWTLMGLALAGSAAGDTLYTLLYGPGQPPVPSAGDPLWLSFLVFGAAALVALGRARFLSADKGRLIESGQAALVVAAFGLILLFYPTLEEVSSADDLTVAMSLVYPIGDIVVMSTLIAALTLSGFRPGPSWLMLGAGLLLFTCCDAIRALQSIGPGYSADSVVEVGWAAAHLMIGYAAWMPASYVRAVEKDDWRTAILPEVVSIVAILIQAGALLGAFPGKYPAARTLIIVAQTLLLIKLADTPRSYRRARSRDPLTGLGNRYALACDLDACFRRRGRRSLLLMCEVSAPEALSGARGRARRDALLQRLGAGLRARVEPSARLYRDEGSDFLVLAPRGPGLDAQRLIAVTIGALAEGAGAPLRVRHGAVLVPEEAADRTQALALAEQRLDAVAIAAGERPVTGDPLALDPEAMRRIGHATIELLIEQLTDASAPALRRATPEELDGRFEGAAPDGPEPFEGLLGRLAEDVLPYMARPAHPGFFAFVPGSGTWPGALGDLIASALNIHTAAWMVSAGPSRLELEVVGWFRDWLGLPATTGGALLSGGSLANLTALACAREARVGQMRPDVVAYVSDQAHSSMPRAARVLGFGPDQVRVLPVDREYRIVPRVLAAAIDADVRAGRRPLLVCASGGTTNTGAVDPLPEIAEICRARGVWLHVDAAYGGFAVLTGRGRDALAGIELADSVTLDPHKWLHQPYECGCLLVRDGAALPAAFTMRPEYLGDTRAAAGEVNFGDEGVQLTRTARALKVWLSVRAFGLQAFRTAIDRSLDLAAQAAARIERSDLLELMAPPSLGVVCFRRRLEGATGEDELAAANARLVAGLEAAGFGLVSSTRLRGRYAIRMCVLNHATTAADVGRTIDFLETTDVARAPRPRPEHPLHATVAETWPAQAAPGRRPAPATLRSLPLFASITAEEAAAAAALATLGDAAAGETIVRQWTLSRDFYVLLEGAVDVLVDGRHVARLEPGAMFGEIAALEWARGYGFPRTATVVVAEPARFVAFPDGAANELVRRVPAVRDRVLATLHERLARV